ncbi:hypothetical protein BV20DRAFT_963647 [Pilatotrama ljubarskyi]|nr:hypothetical protein BV20DRAFT_963647 [Pilatotrama ljubarskyi]
MSDALSSPPRNGPVTKVTYAGRQKQRRRESVASYKEESSSEEDEQQDENKQPSPAKRTASTKMAAKNPSPKKVDVHLPGPSPKRPRHEASGGASAKKPASRARKGAHSRAGSVVSIAREDTMDASNISPTKPMSSVSSKPRSVAAQRTEIADDGADDRSSIGESSKGRIRKTEAERRQFFEEDPNTGDVEPHRVFCKACDVWVELNPKRRYIMRLWLEHRKQCKGAATASPIKVRTNEHTAAAEEAAEDDGTSVAATSTMDAGHKRVMKEEDRKAILEADSRIGEVKPEAVFCKDCQKWVKLSPTTRYSLYHWRVHNQRCSSGVPSSRVATAQRKLKLVNDSNVKAFTPRSVECRLCSATVELEGSSEYDLTKWDEHKSTAHNLDTTPTEAPASTSSKPQSEGASRASPRPPPSTASTEETVVATDATPPSKGVKRAREDDDVPQRSVRPRDEAYEAPEGDAPGFLNWLVAPVKNFFRGFREGLSG